MALLWPARPAAGSEQADGTGTMTVSPSSVPAAQTTTLTFTYNAVSLADGTITLVVPPGWTPPSPTPGPGYTTVSCPSSSPKPTCQLAVDPATMTITISGVYRNTDLGLDVVVTYNMAQAPATAGNSTFTAAEQSFSTGTLTALAVSPTVTVTCPDGTGTMAVSPLTETASSTGTLMFTYTAGSCGLGPGGVVTLTVPDGWTPPNTTAPGTPGFVSWAGGPVSVSAPMTITVPVGALGPGGTVSIDYEMARAPASPGGYTFDAAEQSGAAGTLAALAASPAVQVTPGTPPRHPGGKGTMTVTPSQVTAARQSTLRFTYTAAAEGLSPSGEVTVAVPAGWTPPSGRPGRAGYASSSGGVVTVSGRLITVTGVNLGRGQRLTITYAAGTAPGVAGASTFITSQRPDGTAVLAALTVSPSVAVTLAHAASGWPPIVWVVIGLAVVAVAAGVLALRPWRKDGREGPGSSVRTVPHAGPPAAVTTRDTGSRPTLVVRIEPHASAAVTTIEEAPR